MKFSVISDVHVKNAGDAGEALLLSFLNNPDVQSSDGIFLLGDIFDLMIGSHSQYFSRFSKYFEVIQKLLENKIKIYYVEGNHDFHLKILYENFFKVHKHIDRSLFQLYPHFVIKDQNKTIYFSHGDDVELGNDGYKKYKAFVTSKPLRFVANFLMPYFVITKAGESSSATSRKKNNQKYSHESEVDSIRENFRKSVEQFHSKTHHDIFVLGHSHVQDHYISENNFVYVNNGLAEQTRTYISIENGIISFKSLAL